MRGQASAELIILFSIAVLLFLPVLSASFSYVRDLSFEVQHQSAKISLLSASSATTLVRLHSNNSSANITLFIPSNSNLSISNSESYLSWFGRNRMIEIAEKLPFSYSNSFFQGPSYGKADIR